MNKFLLLITLMCISSQCIYANSVSKYFDQGVIYTGSIFPVDVAKDTDDKIMPIEGLKSGEALTHNILGIIETGNRGIQAAAKNGGITKILFDTKVNKVYIPLGFIPIYVKETKTIVYGK